MEVWVLLALQLLYRFRLDGKDKVKVNNSPFPNGYGPLPTNHPSAVIAVLKRGEVCPLPSALCPLPYALCQILPHVTEKGYIGIDITCHNWQK